MVVLALALLGCGPCHPGSQHSAAPARWDADPDSLTAEKAATHYEAVGGDLMGWTHGERVAFFLRALKDGGESRRLTEDYAK